MPWFDCATPKPITTNTGGIIFNNQGLVLHHAVAIGSLFSYFNNPSSQVSAHFWVGLDGSIEQYVDSSVVAWHGISLNPLFCGVETEGCLQNPWSYAQPMTAPMVQSLAMIYSEGHRRHGWPNALTSSISVPGFGFHRMAVNTACPCDTRLARRQDILNAAFQAPTPPKPQGNDMQTEVFELNPGQYDVLQITGGQLLHKFQIGGTNWQTETVAGPAGGKATKQALTLVGQPEWSIEAGNLWITAEDSNGNVQVFNQPQGTINWGWTPLP